MTKINLLKISFTANCTGSAQFVHNFFYKYIYKVAGKSFGQSLVP